MGNNRKAPERAVNEEEWDEEARGQARILKAFFGTGKQYFGRFNRLFKGVSDPRNPDLITYLLAGLLLTGLDPETPLGARPWGGWSLVPHLIFFLYGFLLVSHDGLQESVRRLRWISLIAGVLLFVAYMVLKIVGGDPAFGTHRYSLIFSLYGLSSWCWILAIWGFGRQHLNFSTPSLRYANQAVLPFYVMHQTVLLVVGYFVVGWAIPDLFKFGLISLSSFALILALLSSWYAVVTYPASCSV